MKVRLSKTAAAQKYPYPCEPGELVEVPDDVGKALVKQTDKWLPATKTTKKEA